MAKSDKIMHNRWVILLSSLITALLILVGGLLWMMLFQGNKQNADSSGISIGESSSSTISAVPSDASTAPTSDSPESESTDEANDALSLSSQSEPEQSYIPIDSSDITVDVPVSESDISGYETVSQNESSAAESDLVPPKPKLVPLSEAADPSYLDDAVFIGDSISVSLSLYKALPAKNVIATQNVSLYGVINGNKVFATAKGKVSLQTAMNGKNPKKIYVLLGANGMSGFSNNKQISYYETLLDQLEAWYPDAVIYVQSMTPVTSYKNKTDKKINNKKIRDFNQKLLALVETRPGKVYYLNVSEALETKYGNLKSIYDGGDGLHFSPAAARAVVAYALEHTVTEE